MFVVRRENLCYLQEEKRSVNKGTNRIIIQQRSTAEGERKVRVNMVEDERVVIMVNLVKLEAGLQSDPPGSSEGIRIQLTLCSS